MHPLCLWTISETSACPWAPLTDSLELIICRQERIMLIWMQAIKALCWTNITTFLCGAGNRSVMRPTVRRTLAKQRYNEATMYPEHATSRRSERIKPTRATLGNTLRAQTLRKLQPELPSKDTIHTAMNFVEENAAAGLQTHGVISPESLLGYYLKRKRQANWWGAWYFSFAAFTSSCLIAHSKGGKTDSYLAKMLWIPCTGQNIDDAAVIVRVSADPCLLFVFTQVWTAVVLPLLGGHRLLHICQSHADSESQGYISLVWHHHAGSGMLGSHLSGSIWRQSSVVRFSCFLSCSISNQALPPERRVKCMFL